MAVLNTIMDGFQTRLATISGLTAYSEWPDQPQFPFAAALLGTTEETTFDGGEDWLVRLTVVVSAAKGRQRAMRDLAGYVDTSGSGSLVAAIEGDVTLGGAVASLIPLGWSDYGSLYSFQDINAAGVGAVYTWKVLI